MIYNDEHLFVALPQCASSFVEGFLVERCGWRKTDPRPFHSWNHRPLCTWFPHNERLTAFAAIRNPWAFYRSLYRHPRRWLSLESTFGFQAWLGTFLCGERIGHYRTWQKLDVDLFTILGHHDIGLLTFNYIVQCAVDPGPFLARKERPEDVKLAVHTHLPVENLRVELGSFLNLAPAHFEALLNEPRRNTSTPPEQGYTPELVELVAHKERLILERFGYTKEDAP